MGRLMWWCQGVILGTKVRVASSRHSHNPSASCFVILQVHKLKEILGLKKQTSWAKRRMWPPEKPVTWNYSLHKRYFFRNEQIPLIQKQQLCGKFSCKWNNFLLKLGEIVCDSWCTGSVTLFILQSFLCPCIVLKGVWYLRVRVKTNQEWRGCVHAINTSRQPKLI